MLVAAENRASQGLLLESPTTLASKSIPLTDTLAWKHSAKRETKFAHDCLQPEMKQCSKQRAAQKETSKENGPESSNSLANR